MIFRPTDNFYLIADDIAFEIERKVYMRHVTVLTGSNAGTTGWTDCSSYISEIPVVEQSIEYEVGQFAAPSVELIGDDINWWKNNVLNATADEFIEMKVQVTLSAKTRTATDEVIVFSGIVDKENITCNELDNTVVFMIRSYIDVLAIAPALSLLSTNEYKRNISSGQYTKLRKIPGVYIVGATLDHELNMGEHTVKYEYESNAVGTFTSSFSL